MFNTVQISKTQSFSRFRKQKNFKIKKKKPSSGISQSRVNIILYSKIEKKNPSSGDSLFFSHLPHQPCDSVRVILQYLCTRMKK